MLKAVVLGGLGPGLPGHYQANILSSYEKEFNPKLLDTSHVGTRRERTTYPNDSMWRLSFLNKASENRMEIYSP